MLPDPHTARAAMTEQVKAVVLVSPNNPTGAEYPDELLEAFFNLARDTGTVLIIDETYRDFRARPGSPHRLFQSSDWAETLVHLYSFSKTYRLMGHRVGAIVTSPTRLAQAEKVLDTMTICTSQLGQIGALQGLTHLSNWVGSEAEEFRDRRALLLKLFSEQLSNWTVHGAGAYFAWITPPFDMPAADFARRLLRDQSILLLPGTMFLPEDMETSAARIAFANVDAQGLEETVRRLSAFEP
jgi:aspartate/methionine/tyrosine aminotransferase